MSKWPFFGRSGSSGSNVRAATPFATTTRSARSVSPLASVTLGPSTATALSRRNAMRGARCSNQFAVTGA